MVIHTVIMNADQLFNRQYCFRWLWRRTHISIGTCAPHVSRQMDNTKGNTLYILKVKKIVLVLSRERNNELTLKATHLSSSVRGDKSLICFRLQTKWRLTSKEALGVICLILCSRNAILNFLSNIINRGKNSSNLDLYKNAPAMKVNYKSISCVCHRTDTKGIRSHRLTFLMANSDIYDVKRKSCFYTIRGNRRLWVFARYIEKTFKISNTECKHLDICLIL